MSKTRFRTPSFVFLVLSGSLLTACGGDDGEDAVAESPSVPSNSASPSGANRPPIITGTVPASIVAGGSYSLRANASDPDGDSLTFSATNLPEWATLNASTGRVTGTPTAADVGIYRNITIQVSDGEATASLGPFDIEVVATATGSALLSWTPPTRNTDGSPLTNLAGYRVYWGTSPGDYPNSVTINNPGITSYVVDQLTPATWYFALTALNTAGAESAFSNVASKTVQ